jgi:hypothetical protein
MGPEDISRNGKREVRELCGRDGARRSIAVTSGAVSSEYDETEVSARRTGVTSLNVQGTGANPSASLRAGSGAPTRGLLPVICGSNQCPAQFFIER